MFSDAGSTPAASTKFRESEIWCPELVEGHALLCAFCTKHALNALSTAKGCRSGAVKRERQIKKWTKAKKEALIFGEKKMLKKLSKSY
jgi:hypothetical protein